ncbi:hypothetical protein T440DRAFT_465479 [Plenodomus tracheiphilus IPT5]|uniref:Zn(2)-C6 fungal-type domain-containing protein n=1 Tax=Plenodomus tracheiphilus IPT5 TaxID=1408161 RepID=A0A6A7BDY3_9PLEO|nr:hypothetical protein T440DRAFT_465479 [Plenodomus tracheiphilus IPT5]
MEDVERPSTTRAGIPRTSQACERCRTLKTRCLPSAEADRCQRCYSADKECVWADAPRRIRKLRAPSRIAQVEQKIDGLVAQLVNATDLRSESATAPVERQPDVSSTPEYEARRTTWIRETKAAPGSWLPVVNFEPNTPRIHQGSGQDPGSSETDRQYLLELRNVHTYSDDEDANQAPARLFRPSKRREAPIADELVQQLLSTREADALINDYRQMSVSFPFVVIPSGVSAIDMHASRPMLFLAIITVASWQDHARQRCLDGIYRRELATRTLIYPRRTLGLVQSVLVYLSWYHFVFSHKTQQIFFLHHLVIGLALDIGLHQDYQPLSIVNQPPPPPPPAEEQRERHRAFLGCYYLASMVSAGLQKPNLLKHTTQMTEWAQNLKQDREYESDETIGHLISLRQIDDQIQDTLFAGSTRDTNLSDPRTLMHMRFMAALLETWKKESSAAESRRVLGLSSSFTDMLLHSVALRSQPSDQFPSHDSTHLSALLSALEAGKRFLDTLLTFPAQEYHLISFCEWMRLPVVIMTIAKLCMPTDAHVAAGWDFKAAQDRTRLDLCLESICYRMQSLSTYDRRSQPHPDFWHAMRAINDLTKTWYMRKIRPADATSSQVTPNSFTGLATSESSCPSSRVVPTPMTHQAEQGYDSLAGINYMQDINMDVQVDTEDDHDPFAAMKHADFDMEQFLDMGIWGDQNYVGMGFGDNGMPF